MPTLLILATHQHFSSSSSSRFSLFQSHPKTSMASNPKPWVTYVNTNDCSQGFCSVYCPQWCYIYVSPPPPIEFPNDEDPSNPNFSPLFISVVGIFASALLLICYYTVISKYCKNTNENVNTERVDRSLDQNVDRILGRNRNSENREPWMQGSNTGLDETLIKLIRVCRYKREDGFVVTDCSICLGEFREDEILRILPKCDHAFHVSCIDRWLKSHSNCPLCRANINFPSPSPISPILSSQPRNLRRNRDQERGDSRTQVSQETQTQIRYGITQFPTSQSTSAVIPLEKRDSVIEIRDECPAYNRRFLVADVVNMIEEVDEDVRDRLERSGGSSR